MTAPQVTAPRDPLVESWEADLQRGLDLSGEGKRFFAEGRVRFLRQCLLELGRRAVNVLDFGCGFGDTCPLLLEELGAESVLGLEISDEIVAAARRAHPEPTCRFERLDAEPAPSSIDLAYCNGVFHHIPPPRRAGSLEHLRRALRPGGLLSFWENNPWNPGTRWVMRRIPFDRDAIPISPLAARRMLGEAGFKVLRLDFLFIFPRRLRALRRLEPHLTRLPLGAQYQVLCQRSP